MQRAIDETNRRRTIQAEYNERNGIVPKTIKKSVSEVIEATKAVSVPRKAATAEERKTENIRRKIAELTVDMRKAAELLQFELAAQIRDEIRRLEDEQGDS